METINKFKAIIYSQFFVFLISLIIFCVAAGFGWEKLHYGFNFLDEGFHMTEGWRLTSGDRLFEDKHYGDPLRLYSVFNSLIFKLHPDITLLEFRKIQYVFTMVSLLIFSFSIINFNKQYWFLPLVLSPFAFNGLLPWGVKPNLNYYTYSHLFIVLHLSFFLIGLYQKNILIKRFLYVLSGISIWGLSFNLLHTSIIILSPIFLFIIHKKFNFKTISFNFIDLCFLLVPFFIFWVCFIAIYQETYILSVISSIKSNLSYSPPEKIKLFMEIKRSIALWCIAIALVYIVLFFVVLKMPRLLSIISLVILSLLMLFAVNKLFHAKDVSMPMWFSSILIAFLLVFWFKIIKGYFTVKHDNGIDEFLIILLLPVTMLAIVMSLFSFNGIYNFMLSSIPIIVAISIYMLYQTKLKREPHVIKWLSLMLFFLPFNYAIVWYTINIPFFDSPPFSVDVIEIEKGFGMGIKTSSKNKLIYDSILEYAENYTDDNDYIIAFPDVPMVYMIAKRRPSLNSSWATFVWSQPDYLNVFYGEEIEIMKRKDRCPKMVFVFPETFPQLIKFPPDNPLTRYVSENMLRLAEVKYKGQPAMLCLIDRKWAMNLNQFKLK